MKQDNLKTEINFFEEHREFLCKHFLNKFVCIKKKKIIGVYDNFQEALKDGVKILGPTSMLIKEILIEDKIMYIYSGA